MVDVLLKYGAAREKQDDRKETPLHKAVMPCNSIERAVIVETFSFKLSIFVGDYTKRCVDKAINDMGKAAELLIKHGANVNSKNIRNETILQTAYSQGV